MVVLAVLMACSSSDGGGPGASGTERYLAGDARYDSYLTGTPPGGSQGVTVTEP